MAIPRLTEMLETSPYFNDPTLEEYVPLDKQALYLKLAEHFQGKISNLYADPEELWDELRVGSPEIWEEFLSQETVNLYVTARTKSLATVQARKSLQNLQKGAKRGDVQAIKYLNEVSGILAGSDNNKTVVLHFVPRANRGK